MFTAGQRGRENTGSYIREVGLIWEDPKARALLEYFTLGMLAGVQFGRAGDVTDSINANNRKVMLFVAFPLSYILSDILKAKFTIATLTSYPHVQLMVES